MTGDESTITEDYTARGPESVHDRFDIQRGDKLRWTATEKGMLRVGVGKQREGTLDDFEPEPMGGDGLETHDLAGHEGDPVFSAETPHEHYEAFENDSLLDFVGDSPRRRRRPTRMRKAIDEANEEYAESVGEEFGL